MENNPELLTDFWDEDQRSSFLSLEDKKFLGHHKILCILMVNGIKCAYSKRYYLYNKNCCYHTREPLMISNFKHQVLVCKPSLDMIDYLTTF